MRIELTTFWSLVKLGMTAILTMQPPGGISEDHLDPVYYQHFNLIFNRFSTLVIILTVMDGGSSF